MDNNELLRAIVDADREARARVEAARRREKLLSGSHAQIDAEAEARAMADARRETEKLRAEAQAAAQNRLAALDRERDEALAALDREFEAKKDACIERIFRAAVGLS